MIPEAVILNPRAGGGASLRSWSEVLEDPWSRSCRLADLPRHEGDPASLAAWMREQLASGRSRFLACGGDGTLNGVINAALSSAELRQGARIGALALGSSNDFHKPFDGPSRGRVAGRSARVAFADACPHDVGRAIFDEGERAFAINASVGVTAEANELFNRGPGPVKMLKRRWVDGAILASALYTFARYRNLELELEIGSERRPVRLTNLGVIKNPYFSGTFRYERGPEPDDGFLGVHLCERMGRAEMLGTLGSLMRGRFPPGRKRASTSARVASVRSVSGERFAVETDGEITRAASVRFEILRRELWLCP